LIRFSDEAHVTGHHSQCTLRARELACARGDHNLFEGVQFEFSNGGLLRVAGGNGTGKTTLLRTVCGLLHPADGGVEWNGEAIEALGEEYHRALAYVGHSNGVKDELSVLENLRFAAKLAGLEADELAMAGALHDFSIAALSSVQCRILSQGQKRRAALARLRLSRARPLWVLDEPFVALDAAGIGIVRGLIEEHLSEGGLVILTTHQEIQLSASNSQQIELQP
jgi:heme exporter protein A